MLKANIKTIHKFLSEKGIRCTFIPESKEILIDQLLVNFDSDDKERERALQIHIEEEDLLPIDEAFGFEGEVKPYSLVHFISFFPFRVERESAAEIARFALFINRALPLPGFHFSEVDLVLFYRYTHFCDGEEIDERILFSLIGTVSSLLDSYSDLFEQVAVEQRPMVDIIKEMVEEIKDEEL